MKIRFSKYHGTGNDFVIIDNRKEHWQPTQEQVSWLCNRRFGIGADGLMLLSEMPGYDFDMRYYNCDGIESTLCGNGGRCITAFARSAGLAGDKAFFHAADGSHVAEYAGTATMPVYRLRMNDTAPGKAYGDGYFINTGSPHFVVFVDRAKETDVVAAGKLLRFDPRFAPGGANIDFVECTGEGLYVRTYERGVENETLSCGTGVTAAALVAASLLEEDPGFYPVETLGGQLKVTFSRKKDLFTEIWLEGPAVMVYSGEIEISN